MSLAGHSEALNQLQRQLISALSTEMMDEHHHSLSPRSIKVIDDLFTLFGHSLMRSPACGRLTRPPGSNTLPKWGPDNYYLRLNSEHSGEDSVEVFRCSTKSPTQEDLEQATHVSDLGHTDRGSRNIHNMNSQCPSGHSTPQNNTSSARNALLGHEAIHAEHTHLEEGASSPDRQYSHDTTSFSVSTPASSPPAAWPCPPSMSLSMDNDVRTGFDQDVVDGAINNALESDDIETYTNFGRRLESSFRTQTLQRDTGSTTLIAEDASNAGEGSLYGGTHDSMQDTHDRPLEGMEETENDMDCTSAVYGAENARNPHLCGDWPGSMSSNKSRMHISSRKPQRCLTCGKTNQRRKEQVDDAHKSQGSPATSKRPKPSVEQMQAIPACMLQPHEVGSAIRHRLGVEDPIPCLAMLVKLFYGIGHPRWFAYLRFVCSTLRRDQQQSFPTSDGSITQSLRLFESLEETQAVCRVLRRYCLVDLVRYRNAHRHTRQRVSKEVLRNMIREACPELRQAAVSDPIFQRKLNTLAQALKHGRHWATLADNFGDGIIALIPVHPAFGLTNTKHIEDVPNKAFEAFLGVLEEHRAQSLYRLSQSLSGLKDLVLRRSHPSCFPFEVKEIPEDYELDSDSLLALCARHSVC